MNVIKISETYRHDDVLFFLLAPFTFWLEFSRVKWQDVEKRDGWKGRCWHLSPSILIQSICYRYIQSCFLSYYWLRSGEIWLKRKKQTRLNRFAEYCIFNPPWTLCLIGSIHLSSSFVVSIERVVKFHAIKMITIRICLYHLLFPLIHLEILHFISSIPIQEWVLVSANYSCLRLHLHLWLMGLEREGHEEHGMTRMNGEWGKLRGELR